MALFILVFGTPEDDEKFIEVYGSKYFETHGGRQAYAWQNIAARKSEEKRNSRSNDLFEKERFGHLMGIRYNDIPKRSLFRRGLKSIFNGP